MKVVQIKEAKASIERKRYGALVLSEFDRLKRTDKRQQVEQRAGVERKAKEAL